MTLVSFLGAMSAGAAAVSAVLWIFSALAKVQYVDRFKEDGTPIGAIVEDGVDILRTAQLQSKLSGFAAVAAAIAAALQTWMYILS